MVSSRHPVSSINAFDRWSVDMHPLALEDVLHQRGHARSKADYFSKHLFLRVLCHTLGSGPTSTEHLRGALFSQASVSSSRTFTNLPRSSSPLPLDEKLGIADEDADVNGDGYDDGDGLADFGAEAPGGSSRGRFGWGDKSRFFDTEAGGKSSTLLVRLPCSFRLLLLSVLENTDLVYSPRSVSVLQMISHLTNSRRGSASMYA